MNAVRWFDIFADEMDQAEGFYKTVLGVEMEDMADPTGEINMRIVPPNKHALKTPVPK